MQGTTKIIVVLA